jgi:hypothetical protein
MSLRRLSLRIGEGHFHLRGVFFSDGIYAKGDSLFGLKGGMGF